jgi:uncharacterized protein YjiS (DUF1127 family)
MTTETLVNRQLSLFADNLVANSADTLELMMAARRLRSRETIKFFRAVGRFLVRHVIAPVVRAAERDRIQRELMAMDDRTLADIGIDRHQIPGIAEKAAAKVFAAEVAQPQAAAEPKLPLVEPTPKVAANQSKPALAA